MSESYSNARLEAFSDGVFAIAMTLLILDIKLPGPEAIRSTGEFWEALWQLVPSIIAFLLSFIIILITWVNHHAAFKLVNAVTTSGMYANGFLLLTTVFLPFPTALVGQYVLTDHAAPAVILYDGVGVLQSIAWIWLVRAALGGHIAKDARAEARLRDSGRFGYSGLAIYAAFTILAIWFPFAIAIATVLSWFGWLAVGIWMKNE